MPTTVKTRAGKLKGSSEDGVAIFRGIPFAKPPLAELRFAEPEPAPSWRGTRDATAFGPCAYQANTAGSPMNQLIQFDEEEPAEDCLLLNVYTPAADSGRRPVMVWIHGGAFVFGSGSQPMYDGRHLASRGDVVVVTINYRLGVFGWLHDPEIGATGNQGLLDQVAALRWVRDEIDGFGGDPGNVTVFGESAGSISISALLATPEAKGLFHKAILQSGSANLTHPAARARSTAQLVQDAAECDLRELAPDALQAVQDLATPRSAGVFYGPVVEPDVLPTNPFDAIGSGSAVGVPVLVGTNQDEWRFFTALDPRTAALDEQALAAMVPRIVQANGGRELDAEVIAGVIEAVRSARSGRGEPVTPTELWYALGTDFVFRHPAMRLAELQSRHAPAYAYLFEWPSPVQAGIIGSGHLVEVPFVFGTHRYPTMRPFAGEGPRADLLAERMQDAWIAFARNGDPSHDQLPMWSRYDAKRRTTMRFGGVCQSEDAPREPERAAWDGLA